MAKRSSGELETGRRDVEPRRTTVRGASRRKPASPIGTVNERVVKETDSTVPVGREPRTGKRARSPMPPAALDRRKQFTGTDEPARPARKTGRR